MSRKNPNSQDPSHTFQWKCSDIVVPLDPTRPVVMGILNVTPDSFSDGGSHNAPDAALAHGREMLSSGAAVIDVGGESTRPGADPVTPEEEIARTLPIVEALASEGAIISIDTMKSQVAEAAVKAGAKIINDVSSGTHDPEMGRVAASTGAGLVLMHMQGEPRTMQTAPSYANVTEEVSSYLRGRAEAMEALGVASESIILDPGIGFGKTLEHNLSLLAQVALLGSCGYPVLIGLSRKSFIGKLTGRGVNERLAGSLAGLVWCIMKGVHVLRVHDVPETLDAVKMIEALKKA
jgi:dihydropteroate synthase